MALARAAGIPVKPPELKADEQIVTAVQAAGIPLDHLLSGYVDSLTVYGPGIVVPDEKPCAAILSGSFAPLHEGHLQLGRVASYLLDRPVMFEIATHNVDKSPLTAGVLTRRLAQFERLPNRVILSREPLYCDKAMLYPGSVFVLGYDTAARAVDPAYYHDDPTNMAEALSAVRSAGCRFLVAGRLMGDRFHTLDDLVIPPGYEDLFNGIPADLFRADISSTELRQRGPTC
nr:hypothetical protein [Anaerolineae bacterium]